jgi:predicted alpha/beta-fold hydrolase
MLTLCCQTPQAFCAAYTDDVRQAMVFVAKRYPNSILLAAGYSLGSNILTKYIGEVRSASGLFSFLHFSYWSIFLCSSAMTMCHLTKQQAGGFKYSSQGRRFVGESV